MTLQEKRLIAGIEENQLPQFKSQLQATLGFEPTVDINWDTFIGADEFPFSRLHGVLFRDLVNGLRDIAKDQFGKEALQAAINRIRIENTSDTASTEYRLNDRELYLKVQLTGSVMKSPTSAQFREWLEKQL
jgi:hypothetical protein